MTGPSKNRTQPEPPPGKSTPSTATASLAIAVAAALFYANTLDVPFVFDDVPNIAEHPATQAERIDWASIERAATQSRSTSRPIAYVSFAVQHAIHGLEVGGYHLVNTAIHAINGVLVYAIALFALGRLARLPDQKWPLRAEDVPWAALVAALLFVAHPVQTQAVTYVVQRMTSLSTLFFLATVLLYLVGRRERQRSERSRTSVRPPIAWIAACLTFALALGTKQISAVLPFTLLLVEWMFYRDASLGWLRRNWTWIAAGTATLAALAVVFLGSRIVEGILAPYEMRDFTLGERLLTQPRVVVFYLSLLAFPAPSRLSLFQAFEPSGSLIAPPQTLLSILALFALAFAAIRFHRGVRIASFAVAWWFLHLAIESSFIGLEMAYEHRIYLPSVGFFLAAGALPFALRSRIESPGGRRNPVLAGAAIAVLVLGGATFARNETWRDPVGFWRDVIAKSPGDYRGHVNLGNQLLARGEIAQAFPHIARGVEVAPESPFSHYAAGVAWERAGRVEDAERSFRAAVERTPNFAAAQRALASALAASGKSREAAEAFATSLKLEPNVTSALIGYASQLAQLGRSGEALPLLERALALDPRSSGALRERGVLALLAGRGRDAEADLEAALTQDPSDAAANFYLGHLREAQHRNAEAITHLERALAANPALHDAGNNLAWILATAREEALRDPTRAVALAEAATAAGPADPGRLDTLAAAYAAAGRFERAAERAARAEALARANGASALAADIAVRAALYRDGRAFVADIEP